LDATANEAVQHGAGKTKSSAKGIGAGHLARVIKPAMPKSDLDRRATETLAKPSRQLNSSHTARQAIKFDL